MQYLVIHKRNYDKFPETEDSISEKTVALEHIENAVLFFYDHDSFLDAYDWIEIHPVLVERPHGQAEPTGDKINGVPVEKLKEIDEGLSPQIKHWAGRALDAETKVTIQAQRLNEASDTINAVYSERNKCVILLLRMAVMMGLKAGIGFDAKAEDGWHNVIYIDLPSGQVSWHIPYTFLLEILAAGVVPSYLKKWDGHTTKEKYARVLSAYAEDAAALATYRAARSDPSQPIVSYEMLDQAE